LSLRNLRSGSERIAGIVKSLRSYARADREPLEEVDLHELLEDTLLLFGSRLRDVEVTREYAQLPLIQGHPAQLNQVWTNLIGNALDAIRDTGRLTIKTQALDSARVAVHIIDNGPGIAPEHRERLFDLNFTTKHGGAAFGLGMGLLICRQIVHQHGGTIGLDSQPGRTSANVILPIAGMPDTNIAADEGAQA
jgi:two-component system, NtrC family, sensor kinase